MSDISVNAAPDVAKRELQQFLGIAERAGLNSERQCQALHLSRQDWQGWLGLLQDGPVPSSPALPLLLRRLGYLINRLDRAERGGCARPWQYSTSQCPVW